LTQFFHHLIHLSFRKQLILFLVLLTNIFWWPVKSSVFLFADNAPRSRASAKLWYTGIKKPLEVWYETLMVNQNRSELQQYVPLNLDFGGAFRYRAKLEVLGVASTNVQDLFILFF